MSLHGTFSYQTTRPPHPFFLLITTQIGVALRRNFFFCLKKKSPDRLSDMGFELVPHADDQQCLKF